MMSKYARAATTSPHLASARPSTDVILASRLYVAAAMVALAYVAWLRLLERCAVTATALLVYRTFPAQTAACVRVLFLAFRTALWVTLVDFMSEDNCQPYYESELAGLLRLRFSNCLRSGVHFAARGDGDGEGEAFACTDGYRASVSLRARRVEPLRFGVAGRGAVADIGPLNDYVNRLRAAAGTGVGILFDEDSAFDDNSQRVFSQIARLMRSHESYGELFAPRQRELLAPVRVWDKGVVVPGAWIMCTRDYALVFQDVGAGDESLCEVVAIRSGKRMYRCIFASRLLDLERRILAGLVAVVRAESFGLVSSGCFFWGMNVLQSSGFDELFQYLLSGRDVFVSNLGRGGLSTLVI